MFDHTKLEWTPEELNQHLKADAKHKCRKNRDYDKARNRSLAEDFRQRVIR